MFLGAVLIRGRHFFFKISFFFLIRRIQTKKTKFSYPELKVEEFANKKKNTIEFK